ncbi:hypothetical protein BC739_004824 [Kutzneria viridogrisea]|uniref:PemK-like, MazF-like toxin of type II toxin-antitoxin system n=1 Tax=Kutzneria viridogrisea TaxID=47990 RepID=A0ABR6BL69_9PSEU|nr:type II toxin-antitoxin system PemK/MazF family toxin [Kutzneria albida]MBA8927618.1 hypothetical protein [Kutzneria viridogrisea]
MSEHGPTPRPARGAVTQVHHVERSAKLDYAPDLDGFADPGEVVWAWVPFEEDPQIGKDRPLLVVGRLGGALLGLMLSSKQHEGWLDLGAGAWDSEGRPSHLRLDRVYELDEHDIRREGSVLAPDRFGLVVDALRARGWR